MLYVVRGEGCGTLLDQLTSSLGWTTLAALSKISTSIHSYRDTRMMIDV